MSDTGKQRVLLRDFVVSTEIVVRSVRRMYELQAQIGNYPASVWSDEELRRITHARGRLAETLEAFVPKGEQDE